MVVAVVAAEALVAARQQAEVALMFMASLVLALRELVTAVVAVARAG